MRFADDRHRDPLMTRIAANLDRMFTDMPLLERFSAARIAGFEFVELACPDDISIQELERALNRNRLDIAMLSTPLGDLNTGEHGFMGVPRRIADFRQGFERTLAYADALEIEMVHLMAGVADRKRTQKMLTRNLAWAAYNAGDRTLVLGPLGSDLCPDYAVESFSHAVELMDWVGAPNLGLHFDARHIQDTGFDLGTMWSQFGTRVRHIDVSAVSHVASIDLNAFLDHLAHDGYEGLICTETVRGDGV